MNIELENQLERLQNGFSGPSQDTNGKQSFAIGFWKGVDTLTRLQQENKETKTLLTAKQAREIQAKISRPKPTNSTEKLLNLVLKKIEIHANDGFTGMYIPTYKLNAECIQKLRDLGYVVEETSNYDDENVLEPVCHICWEDDDESNQFFSKETLKDVFGDAEGIELYEKTKQ